MKRTSLFMPEQMLEKLAALSKRSGVPVSELVRRAIDAFLKKEDRSKP